MTVRRRAELGAASPTAGQAAGTKRHLNDSQEALKRQRALQEKSKRAQKRYRERKKARGLGSHPRGPVRAPGAAPGARPGGLAGSGRAARPARAPGMLTCPSSGAQAQTEDYKRQIEELSTRLSNICAEKANLEARNSLLARPRGRPDLPARGTRPVRACRAWCFRPGRHGRRTCQNGAGLARTGAKLARPGAGPGCEGRTGQPARAARVGGRGACA